MFDPISTLADSRSFATLPSGPQALPHDLAPARTAFLDAPVHFVKSPSDCSLFFFTRSKRRSHGHRNGIRRNFAATVLVRRRVPSDESYTWNRIDRRERSVDASGDIGYYFPREHFCP